MKKVSLVCGDSYCASYLVKTVSESGGGGLVNDTENVETSDSTGILGGGTLSVVEVSRDGDNRVAA